ncbi:MAG: RluA family pseudouridine synthase [Polyangiaceae bacterium]
MKRKASSERKPSRSAVKQPSHVRTRTQRTRDGIQFDANGRRGIDAVPADESASDSTWERRPFSDSKSEELSVPAHVPPTALTRILRNVFESLSWSRCRSLVESGKVSVDGERVTDVARLVRPGSIIRIEPRAPRVQTGTLGKVEIVYRDAQIVVVEKPAGVSTVAFDESERDNLEERTRRTLSLLRGERCPPLGVVHRIDKETTGLVVFARTTTAKRHLKQQFRFHTNHRSYLALACGHVTSSRIESRLVEDRGDGKRGSTQNPNLGQVAITYVEAVEHFARATLIRCRLETGRTHQIRIHLAESGHPLLGERVYGRVEEEQGVHVPRLMLHAAELGITHPTRDERLLFRSELPADFSNLLDRLRQR